ncbi:MAG: YcfL family protein [Plesiomonas sp.]|uniref:YcfL family protein n=1 Tax=Plesiomonas sp. TaxID=2486279 RepID=UPI003F371AC7
MRSLWVAFWLVALAGTTLAGCAPATRGFKIDQQQQVVVADADSSRAVGIERIRSGKKAQRLHVQVEIKNQHQQAQLLEYRFYWYNAQGLEIDRDTAPWHTLTVPANGIHTIYAVAAEPNVEYFRLYVRTKK